MWKHYFHATSLAGGNYKSRNREENIQLWEVHWGLSVWPTRSLHASKKKVASYSSQNWCHSPDLGYSSSSFSSNGDNQSSTLSFWCPLKSTMLCLCHLRLDSCNFRLSCPLLIQPHTEVKKFLLKGTKEKRDGLLVTCKCWNIEVFCV